jgi:hypothetical protein
MQAALDSAALMLSRDLSQSTITTSQVSSKATTYFTALYNNKDVANISVSASYAPGSSTSGSNVVRNAAGSLPTQFMGVAGVPNMNFNAARRRPGAQICFAWRSCSTTPDRWPTTTRSERSRPPPGISILPPTSNWTSINNTINAMSPGGTPIKPSGCNVPMA